MIVDDDEPQQTQNKVYLRMTGKLNQLITVVEMF